MNKQLIQKFRARVPIICIKALDRFRFLEWIINLKKNDGTKIFNGVRYIDNTGIFDISQTDIIDIQNEVAFKSIENNFNIIDEIDEFIKTSEIKSCLVISGFDFSNNSLFKTRLFNIITKLKPNGLTIILLNHPQIKELEPVINYDFFSLPDENEIYKFIYENLHRLVSKSGNLFVTTNIDTIDIHSLVNACKGLYLEQINLILKQAVITKSINYNFFNKEKIKLISKNVKGVTIYNPVNSDELGGLDNLKTYIQNRKDKIQNIKFKLKGILLYGIPGAGKSLASKVIASELKLPLLKFDIALLKNKLLGETERVTKQTLTVIESMAPCVLWIDELDKALSGGRSSSMTDGGTTNNIIGMLLTWIQENDKLIYMVATANDLDDLMNISQGAIIRRFDDMFFVDLPTFEEKKRILDIMNKKYDTNYDYSILKKMNNWTGAEIEKAIRNSIFDGIDMAIKNIKPLYNQNYDKLNELRKWSYNNARIANKIQNKNNSNISIRKDEYNHLMINNID